MVSQTDLDQGGTFRQFQRRWLGPSVGWVWTPIDNVLAIAVAGTFSPVNGTTLITVNVAGLVTINLFNPIPPLTSPANSIPGPSLALPLTIVDIGGHASAFNITINPSAGKKIIGLNSISITNDFGAFTLIPNLTTGDWVWTQ